MVLYRLAGYLHELIYFTKISDIEGYINSSSYLCH